jgi:hypothetical protein
MVCLANPEQELSLLCLILVRLPRGSPVNVRVSQDCMDSVFSLPSPSARIPDVG